MQMLFNSHALGLSGSLKHWVGS